MVQISHLLGYLRLRVFHPPTRIHVRLLGPCFKTGEMVIFRQRLERYLRPRSNRRQNNCTARPTHADQHNTLRFLALTRHKTEVHTDNHFLPPQQFQALLTLFSKCFSSFLHSTCSLSVSRQYLALEGIYLQIRAAFPNYPTLRKHLVEYRNTADGALTLSGVPFQGTWAVDDTEIASVDYNSRGIFSWAFPGSLAVTRGILVSFFSSA